MMYNIRSGAIRWQIPYFLSDDNCNVCFISHLLQNIQKLRQIQDFYLENLGQGHEYNIIIRNGPIR